jgi:hypothetical protein
LGFPTQVSKSLGVVATLPLRGSLRSHSLPAPTTTSMRMILSLSTSSQRLIRRSLSPEKSNDLLLELPSKCRGLRPMSLHPFREASGGSRRKRTLSQLTKRVRCVGPRPGPSNPLKTLTAQISTGEKTSQRFRDKPSISQLSSSPALKRYRSPCRLKI